MSRFTSDLQACKTAPAELIHEWPGSRSPSTRRSEHALSSVHPSPPIGSRRRLANSSRFHPDLVLAGVGAHTFYEHTAAHSARHASAPGADFWLPFELGIFGKSGRDAARYSCRPGTSWSTASTARVATLRAQFLWACARPFDGRHRGPSLDASGPSARFDRLAMPSDRLTSPVPCPQLTAAVPNTALHLACGLISSALLVAFREAASPLPFRGLASGLVVPLRHMQVNARSLARRSLPLNVEVVAVELWHLDDP